MNNKRYMDFVPAKAKREVPKATAKPKKVAPEKIIPKEKPAVRRAVPKEIPREASREKEPELGVIEDLNVGSRAISRSHFNEDKDGVRAAKAKKVGLKEQVPEKTSASGLSTKPKANNETFKTPKSPFINQDKVTKRPLSKNVYQKKVVVPKEEPKGPVTIITKPEKQAHVSLIVTIILTIILGAAAGTVAFLLLPK